MARGEENERMKQPFLIYPRWTIRIRAIFLRNPDAEEVLMQSRHLPDFRDFLRVYELLKKRPESMILRLPF